MADSTGSASGADWSTRRSSDGLRFLLVNPTIVDKREHVHLGVGAVSTYVARHSAHRVRVLDFLATRNRWRARLHEVVAEFRPDVIGMYVCTPYFPAACEVARELKRAAPNAPILAGGHHPTLAPDDVMAASCFDMLIIGEGEKPTIKLLDTLAAGAPLEEVPGLWWREAGEVRKTPKDRLLEAAHMPGVDWSLHDEETLRANFYFWGMLPVMASRGCPARCSFCSITNVQKLYAGERFLRFRDPIEVIDEIEADWARYRDYGMRMVSFYDLNFLVNPRWLKQFTDEYKRRGLNRTLKWNGYTRADHVSPATLECLKDSGCVNLRVGIEAANPYMRNILYEKDVPQQVLLDALRGIKKLGISITGYFLVGGPGERPEWLMESLELAKREGVDFPVFFLYKPLAGTDILKQADALGSHVLADTMGAGADFLHGVNMSHRYVKAWQLKFFLLLSHIAFGPRLIRAQARRTGWRYPLLLAQYVARGVKRGFTPYGAFTYFVFYGDDHFMNPPLIDAAPAPGLGWRALSGLARRLLGHSGEPEPVIERPGRAAGLDAVAVPLPHATQPAQEDMPIAVRSSPAPRMERQAV